MIRIKKIILESLYDDNEDNGIMEFSYGDNQQNIDEVYKQLEKRLSSIGIENIVHYPQNSKIAIICPPSLSQQARETAELCGFRLDNELFDVSSTRNNDKPQNDRTSRLGSGFGNNKYGF